MRVAPHLDLDRLQDAFNVFDHFVVPEPQHAVPGSPQAGIATFVVSLAFFSVLTAVEFDNQSALETNKVDDIGTNRPLAAKLERLQSPGAQMTPEAVLDFRCASTQVARSLQRHQRSPNDGRAVGETLIPRLLPQAGEGARPRE